MPAKGTGKNQGLSCSVDGCDTPAFCRGWCAMHYQSWRRLGDPNLALTVRSRNNEGMKWRTLDGKTVPYYAWLWVQHNGPIPRCECDAGEAFHVHHKDHNHSHDVIENLELLPGAGPGSHTAHHWECRERCTECRVEGCQSTSTKGWVDDYCPAHYRQMRQHGAIISVSAKRLGKKKKWTTCSVEGCDSEGYCLDYCIRHYEQMRQHGEVKHIDKVVGGTKKWTTCKVEGCPPSSMKRASNGYCERHYQQMKRHGKIVSVNPIPKSESGSQGAMKRWRTESA